MSKLAVINRTNLKQLTLVWRFEPSAIHSGEDSDSIITFSPGGNGILFIQNNQVYWMEIATGKILRTFSADNLFPGEEQPIILSAIFSPDGSKVAGLTSAGLALWDTQSTKALWTADWGNGEPTAIPQTNAEINRDLVFSRDGSLLVTNSRMGNRDTRVWSTASGRMIKVLASGDQVDAQFSRDGRTLYTADGHTTDPAIRIWSSETWQQVGSVRVQGGVRTLEVSNSGEILAVGGSGPDGSVEVVDYRIRDWAILGKVEDRYTVDAGPELNIDSGILAFTAKGSEAHPASTIQFYDPDFLTFLFSIDYSLPAPIRHLSFSPNGKILALQAKNGTTLFYGVPVR
jgi:hypothetical protein